LLSVGVPFFLVTMASQNAPASPPCRPQAIGSRFAADCRHRRPGAAAVAFGVYSICIAAITAAICQSPEAHPDPQKRWLAAAAAGGFYLLAGMFGGSITSLMSALPIAWIQMLAGLALLGTIGGSLFQALNQESERDAAVVTFLVTASGVTLAGIGSAFWGWCSAASATFCCQRCAARSCEGVRPVALFTRLLKWLAELKPQAMAISVNGSAVADQRLRFNHPALHHVLMRRHLHRLAEHPRKMVFA
jgi:benzoate membrane transport protein